MSQSGFVDFVRVLTLLLEAKVDFVVVGGLALQLHGGDVLTYDVDFAFARRRENAERLAQALAPYHPKPVDWPEELPFIWDAQAILNMTTMTLETKIGRIDFLAEPDGAPTYPVLRERAAVFELTGHELHVASIDDLISMKRAAGRPKDLAHIAELETLKRLLEEG